MSQGDGRRASCSPATRRGGSRRTSPSCLYCGDERLGLDELSGKRRICAIGRYRIIDRNQCRLRPLASLIVDMNTPNRAILIGGVVAAAVIVGVVTLLLYEKQDYRDCVAQMWDRKHPAEVRQRQSDADFRECEAYRLREGANCDCKVAFGQPKFCSTHSRIERQVLEDSAGADLIPDPPAHITHATVSHSKSYAALMPT